MEHQSTVILLAGPAGSGKSSTAARIAQHPDWVHISEDLYWVFIKQGRPAGELRTPAEQDIVQQQVIEQVLEVVSSNKNVVLEFTLYEDPPRPLLRYQDALGGDNIRLVTRILRPDVDEILRRIEARARPMDNDPARIRTNVEHQVRILWSAHIDDAWVIDTTTPTLEEVYQRHFKPVVEP